MLKLKFVEVAFAYYDAPHPQFQIPAEPHYLVVAGSVPGKLNPGMHVCADQLREVDVPVPPTPIYENWKARPKFLRSPKEFFRRRFSKS